MYDPASVPFDPAYAETFANKPVAHRVFSEKSADLGEDESWGTWQRIIASYWGCTTMLDDLLGRILAALDELGEAENTMVVFGTDHGDMLGAHRQFEKGPSCYEEAYHIPLIVAHPGCRTPGAVNDDFVYLHDVYPTLLEVAGVELPNVPDHRSLLPACLDSSASNGREHLYTQFYRQIVTIDQRMIRTRTHKYVFNRHDLDELYDLVADPHELTNLIDDPALASIRSKLMRRLVTSMTELEDPLRPHFLSERLLPSRP
jgi:arylsulfatase A-like enzyme